MSLLCYFMITEIFCRKPITFDLVNELFIIFVFRTLNHFKRLVENILLFITILIVHSCFVRLYVSVGETDEIHRMPIRRYRKQQRTIAVFIPFDR